MVESKKATVLARSFEQPQNRNELPIGSIIAQRDCTYYILSRHQAVKVNYYRNISVAYFCKYKYTEGKLTVEKGGIGLPLNQMKVLKSNLDNIFEAMKHLETKQK